MMFHLDQSKQCYFGHIGKLYLCSLSSILLQKKDELHYSCGKVKAGVVMVQCRKEGKSILCAYWRLTVFIGGLSV